MPKEWQPRRALCPPSIAPLEVNRGRRGIVVLFLGLLLVPRGARAEEAWALLLPPVEVRDRPIIMKAAPLEKWSIVKQYETGGACRHDQAEAVAAMTRQANGCEEKYGVKSCVQTKVALYEYIWSRCVPYESSRQSQPQAGQAR